MINQLTRMRWGVFLGSCLPLLISGPAQASEEKIHPLERIIMVADTGAPFHEVKVDIEAKSPEEGPGSIRSLSLSVDGEFVKVPDAAYADLESPMLRTAEIRTTGGIGEIGPSLYIYFELAHRSPDKKWRPKEVHIAYREGEIQDRSIKVPESDGDYERIKKEL